MACARSTRHSARASIHSVSSMRHSPGCGIVTKLVGDDAFRDTCFGADRMQVSAKLSDQGFPGAGTCQQAAIYRQWIEGAEEAETLDQLTHEGVYRDHAFRLQLAERHVNRPLIGAGGVEAIEGKVGRLANTHAGVPEQQQDVSAQIVAAQQFLLEELILLRGEGTGQASRGAGNVLATEE